MNKLNISCILKLIDQLTYEDTNELKDILNKDEEEIWLIKSKGDTKYCIIKGTKKNLNSEMIKKGFIFHKTRSKNGTLCSHNNTFTIVLKNCKSCNSPICHHNKTDFYCILCDSSKCEHILNDIFCLQKEELTN